MEIRHLKNGNKVYVCANKQELKNLSAKSLKHGDAVLVGKYYIMIRYGTYDDPGKYDTPALCSYTELINGKRLGCTPGSSPGFTPYFIDTFLSS